MSFLVKSKANAVPFLRQLNRSSEVGVAWSGADAIEIASVDRARSTTGTENRKQRSNASMKVMKTPIEKNQYWIIKLCDLCITCSVMDHELLAQYKGNYQQRESGNNRPVSHIKFAETTKDVYL